MDRIGRYNIDDNIKTKPQYGQGKTGNLRYFLRVLGYCSLFFFLLSATNTASVRATTDVGDNPLLAEITLFDQLFGQPTSSGIKHNIPYPFEALLRELSNLLPTMPNQKNQSFSTVLIPQGRSLQREAAFPEVYRYPRIVLALDSESSQRHLVKDRLYLGYQEKAEQIEIISYNEHSGQFEFQIVTDYAANKTPVVKYANTLLCMSCHQNGAPIFPEIVWSETNFDPRISDRIGSYTSHYHGIRTNSISGQAGRVDFSTNRANLFSTYQRIWREGCRQSQDPIVEFRCRAGVFKEMVRYRLGAELVSRNNDTELDLDYRLQIKQNWRHLWPDGLPIPNSDIPNRIPPTHLAPVDLPPNLDPLKIRPSRIHWQEDSDLDRSIKGLADTFLLQNDIKHLDTALRDMPAEITGVAKDYTGDCEFNQTPFSGDDIWMDIACMARSDKGDIIDISGKLIIDKNGLIQGGLSSLYLTNNGQAMQIPVTGAMIPDVAAQSVPRLSLRNHSENIRARMKDGTTMTDITFSWDTRNTDTPEEGIQFGGKVALKLSRDLYRVEQGINELLHDAETGLFDGFNDQPIQGITLMSGLFDKLNISYQRPIVQITPLEPQATDLKSTVYDFYQPVVSDKFPLKLFGQYCGSCHQSNARLPPGFLLGNSSQVEANLRSCAERIGFRLAMWKQNNDSRLKTPMPPPYFINTVFPNVRDWIESEDYRRLLGYIDSLRTTEQETQPGVPYADLAACLER